MAVGFVALLASIFAMAFLHAYLLYDKFLSVVVLLGHGHTGSGGGAGANICPQSNVLYPESTSHAQLWKSLGRDSDNDAFVTRAENFIECFVLCGISFSGTPIIIMLNEVRSHTILWALSVRTSGGRLSGRFMTTSNKHFLSRA
jgi:hypothetical protein